MKYRNLTQAAEAAGVPYCRGIVSGSYCGDPATVTERHRRGFIDERVHLDRQRITKGTLKLFALMAARLELDAELEGVDPWEAQWRTAVRGEQILRERMGIRLSHKAWSFARASVRAQIVKVDPSPARTAAMAWVQMKP